MSTRYNVNAITLSIDNDQSLTFSRGLTSPYIIPCLTNNAPLTVDDSVEVFCTLQPTLTYDVLANDSDPDGDPMRLLSAEFVNKSDTLYATLSVDTVAGTI